MPIHPNPLSKDPPNAHGESDIYILPHLSTLQLSAWLTVPLYSEVLYPAPLSPATRTAIETATTARHRAALLDDAEYRITSIVGCEEPEVGEPWVVVGFVKYAVVADGAGRWGPVEDAGGQGQGGGKEEKRTWPEGTHGAFVQWFWPRLVGLRRKYAAELGRFVFVDIVATEPGWMRRGVGGLCMEEVCREADERGWACFLEGTEEGRSLYEKWGFVVREELWVDLGRWRGGVGVDIGEGWRGEGAREGEGEGWYRMVVMVRPPRGKE